MVEVVVIGAGHRARLYSEYSRSHPERMKVVGVVEVDDRRRVDFQTKYSLDGNRVFDNFDHFAATDKFAHAVIVASPDDCHFEQTMRSLERGYHVLLEKPIAKSMDECITISKRSEELGLIVGVCYPLRYHPLYLRAHELTQGGELGELLMVNHTEYIGYERMTHNFVRGPWNRDDTSGPLLLSKACHDLDLIAWLTDSWCTSLNSVGSLHWFRAKNAPTGSADRCLDCKFNEECPYSAVSIYLKKGLWLRHFHSGNVQQVEYELSTGPYGRCVYRCDNTVFDNQLLMLSMESGVNVSVSLNAFTALSTRRTHLMGSLGEVSIDTERMELKWRRFVDQRAQMEDFSIFPSAMHAGADWAIVEHFLEAVEGGDGGDLSISIARAIESHRIAFMC